MYKKFITVIGIIVFLCGSSVFAEVDIPKKYWVPNKPGGYCFYVAAETIGRYYDIKNLYDFEVDGNHYGLGSWYEQWPSQGASDNDINESLTNLGIKYKIYKESTIQWLKEKLHEGIPIIITSIWSTPNSYHAYIAVDIDDQWIKIIDSNRIKDYIWISRQWFDSHWEGWALIIEK